MESKPASDLPQIRKQIEERKHMIEQGKFRFQLPTVLEIDEAYLRLNELEHILTLFPNPLPSSME